MTTIHPLGYVLRTFREQRGLTQKDLATRTGCRDTFLSRVENGYAQLTNAKVLSKLAVALELSTLETGQLFDAANNSQRVIHLPSDLSAQALTVIHQVIRACTLFDDEIFRNEKLAAKSRHS